jgi:hypothetical protein
MVQVEWLVPAKPDDISTGRQRIAAHLRDRGYSVHQTADRQQALRNVIQEHPDVFMSTTSAGGLIAPATKLNGTSMVVDYVDPILQLYHSGSYPMARLAQSLQHAAFRLADGIAYVYDEERLRVERYDTQHRQTSLGVDYERFADPDPESVTRMRDRLSQLGVADPFAVYLGGLEDIYQIPEMLAGAVETKVPLVVAGCGEYEGLVREYADRHEHIHMLGTIPHASVPGLLAHAACGVSLVDDPHTVKALEYAAAGLPIVHIEGRAEATLPDSGVIWTDTAATDVGTALLVGIHDEIDTTELDTYAREHDYQRVVDDYEALIQSCA